MSKRKNIAFTQRLAHVDRFVSENGHGWIPARFDTEPQTRFGFWANEIRHKKASGVLPERHMDELVQHGFLFEKPQGLKKQSFKRVTLADISADGKDAPSSASSTSGHGGEGTGDDAAGEEGEEDDDAGVRNEDAQVEPIVLQFTSRPPPEKMAAVQRTALRPEGYPVSTASLDDLIESGCRFGAILADPPWQYDNRASNGAAENHYSTMSIDDLCALPVPDLALNDAYLFLWATSPLLPEALRLMDAWGFRYKTNMIWGKPRFGMGNYWRSAHELLLLGVRGKPNGWLRHDIASYLIAPSGRHSAKPSVFRDMVTSVCDGPYLEMFGREDAGGWTTFGNQVQPTLFASMDVPTPSHYHEKLKEDPQKAEPDDLLPKVPVNGSFPDASFRAIFNMR